MENDEPQKNEKRPKDPKPEERNLPIPMAEQALASSAHSRINIPLNLENWRDLEQHQVEQLTWFHQHVLDERIPWSKINSLLPKPGKRGGFYDKSVIYKMIKGIYEGSWDNLIESIIAYRKVATKRAKIKRSTFAHNEVSRLIFEALDYVSSLGGIAEIIGESGHGKTICAQAWQHENNSGRTVMVECPAAGGIKGLLREICEKINANQNQSILGMQQSIKRAFNSNRNLIIDEAFRLAPLGKEVNPRLLDWLRWLHDQTGVNMAFLVTARFDANLKKNSYMFEQVLGRIDMPVRLPRELGPDVFMPLLQQYVPTPSRDLVDIAEAIVNQPLGGRMRSLDKLLKFAASTAFARKEKLAEKHVLAAIKKRKSMMGELQYAKK